MGYIGGKEGEQKKKFGSYEIENIDNPFVLTLAVNHLPSPTNLKRWRITTETMCTLCSKDVCTTADILGACKVSLQQGRYTFRHDTVLREVIEVLKTFILNIKVTVPISPKSSIKFVRKGTKVPRKRTPPVGILHHASDWILLADLSKTYCFPVHIAFTQLRLDITIFSNNLRKVIFIVKKIWNPGMGLRSIITQL